MPDKSNLDTILKNTPLALVVIGLFLFVIGAAGGLPSFSLLIDDLGWRIALALMGFIVTSIGALIILREQESQESEVKIRKNNQLKIVSPDKNRVIEVERHFEVSGNYTGKIPENGLQIYSVHGLQYWPIMKPGEYSANEGVWRAQVQIGGEPGPRTIVVGTGGKAAHAMNTYYWRVGAKKDVWIGIDMLTPDFVECDRVNVFRK